MERIECACNECYTWIYISSCMAKQEMWWDPSSFARPLKSAPRRLYMRKRAHSDSNCSRLNSLCLMKLRNPSWHRSFPPCSSLLSLCFLDGVQSLMDETENCVCFAIIIIKKKSIPFWVNIAPIPQITFGKIPHSHSGSLRLCVVDRRCAAFSVQNFKQSNIGIDSMFDYEWKHGFAVLAPSPSLRLSLSLSPAAPPNNHCSQMVPNLRKW